VQKGKCIGFIKTCCFFFLSKHYYYIRKDISIITFEVGSAIVNRILWIFDKVKSEKSQTLFIIIKNTKKKNNKGKTEIFKQNRVCFIVVII
jgi:hypothetical protein